MSRSVQDAVKALMEQGGGRGLLLAGLGQAEAQRCRFLSRFGAARLDRLSAAEILTLLGTGEADPGDAGSVAERTRQAMQRAVLALSGVRGSDLRLEALQEAVASAAPEFVEAAWLHEYLHKHFPDLVTGSATRAELHEHLRFIGIASGADGLYVCDAHIIRFWQDVPALKDVPPPLRYRFGEPPLRERLRARLKPAGGAEAGVLPVYSLKAVAASVPAGQWGPGAGEHLVELLGTMRVTLPKRRLTDRMFVAQIVGHSMDDGKSGICDGEHAVFSFDVEALDAGPIVLCRGAFHDPELGSYAVKRYVEERAGDGTVRRVRLLSLNPDKTRFPDILIEGDLGHAVQVVATLIGPVPATTGGSRKGMRDLGTETGIERVRERMAQSIARFFHASPPAAGEPEGEVSREAWEARLELGEQGLVIRLGPLRGLPRFVRELEVVAGDQVARIVAANVREQSYRVAVVPAAATYEVRAPGFEEELGADLGRLQVAGLRGDRATVFRVDAAGWGQRLEGTSLSVGQRYRLLCPPGLVAHIPPGEAALLPGGYAGWEPDLGAPPPGSLVSALKKIGLEVGSSPVFELSWVGVPPRSYREGLGRERYPVFAPGDRPILQLIVPAGTEPPVIFVEGPGGHVRHPLGSGPGRRWLELGELEAGEYALEALSEQSRIPIARCYFAVEENAERWPVAAAHVRIGALRLAVEGAVVPWDGDLTELGDAPMDVQAEAPPLWPVQVEWRGAQAQRFGTIHADEAGKVDLARVIVGTKEVRRRHRIGDLHLNFGELGGLALRHTRQPEEPAIRAQLVALLEERRSLLREAAHAGDLLRTLWLSPVLEILGYHLRDLPSDGLPDPIPGLSASLLLLPERVERDVRGLVMRPVAGLVVGGRDMDLKSQGGSTPRGYAARLCSRYRLRQAVLTDGLRFARFTAGSGLLPQWHLEQALTDTTGTLLESFLSLFIAEQQS